MHIIGSNVRANYMCGPLDNNKAFLDKSIASKLLTETRSCRLTITPYQYYVIDPCQETFTCNYKITLRADVPFQEWQARVLDKGTTCVPTS